MRIAAGVHVALGAIEPRRFLEHRHIARRLEIAGLAGLDRRVARLLRDEREPADLELGAGRDDEIGAARPRDEAGLGLDVVRILQRVGRDVDADLVAAQLLRQRAPFGNRGEHAQCRERRAGERGERRTGNHTQ